MNANHTNGHGVGVRSASLISLPSELLHHIFLLCSPSDLGALSQVNRALHAHLTDAPQLWKEVYLQWWDDFPATASTSYRHDAVVHDCCPSTRTLRASGTSVPWGLFETDVSKQVLNALKRNPTATVAAAAAGEADEKSKVHSVAPPFDYAEQVRRRTWAGKQVKALQPRPISAYANYNEVMRTLLAIARSRAPRMRSSDGVYGDDARTVAALHLTEKSKSADYLADLLTTHFDNNTDGNPTHPTFRQLIFPRTDVKKLHAWQLDILFERDKHLGNASTAVPESASTLTKKKAQSSTRNNEKRTRSASSSSSSPSKAAKRTRSSSSNADDPHPVTAASTSSASFPRRRSARVQLSSYPNDLNHLLHDQHSKGIITLDDGSGVVALESLELLDEQLAAELHVLHGIHAGNPFKSTRIHDLVAQTGGDDEIETNGAAEQPPGNDGDGDDDEDDHEDDDDDDNELGHLGGFFNFVERENMRQAPLGASDLGGDYDKLRARAREVVYDNSRFGPENSYGPLRAWRERFEPLDGPHVLLNDEENGADDADFDEPMNEQELRMIARVMERQVAEPEDWSSEEDEEEDEEEDDEDGGLRFVIQADNLEQAAERGELGEEWDVAEEGEEDNNGDDEGDQDGEDGEGGEDDDDDDDDDEDFDGSTWDDSEDEENLRERHLFGELRRLAISLSRGILPYFEVTQMKELARGTSVKESASTASETTATKQRKGKRSRTSQRRPATVTENEATNSLEASPPLPTRIQDVFRIGKRVDWIVVEAIMIVMYCNIRHAVLSHEWGRSFRLPGTRRSLTGRDPYARPINDLAARPIGDEAWRVVPRPRHGNYNPHKAWQNLIALPCGWSHSRGEQDARWSAHPTNGAANEDDPKSRSRKPHDWAGVESVWIGTYAFLDWNHWAYYNGRDPVMRGLSDPEDMTRARGPMPGSYATGTPDLTHEREAVGDCLQLRMELLPLEDQKPFNKNDRAVSYLEGHDAEFIDDEEEGASAATAANGGERKSTCQTQQAPGQYPPLRFRGHTRTYMHDRPPVPRGELYGVVRPIYAEADEKALNAPRAIVAIHWDITHRYDGEDAWSLSGIQAGPPGTRSPIYGIWGAAARQDNTSPCGPFAYYKVDERPWKSLEEQHQRETGATAR